jgi:hypothetical protein
MAEFFETGPVVETMPSSGTPPPPPSGAVDISETPATPPAKAKPAAPAERPTGKARDRIFAKLEGKQAIEAPKAKEEATTETPEAATPDQPPTETKEGEETPAATPEKGKRESPWKVVEKYKERTRTLEKELAEAKASIAPESDIKAMKTRLEQAEKALTEKEEFIRLHSYQASDEYRTKFQQPWEQAWQKTAKQMSEISVVDPQTGAERQATVQDIERLVNSPLGVARKMADEMFGSFANDAMNMRGKIVELYEAQQEAITKAKTDGESWQRTQSEAQTKQMEALRQEVVQTWKKANEEALADARYSQYFKPKEGDTEWNQRLTKGTELVDKAFATMRPDFSTGEPRAEVIKRHAAIRQRAIAFGPLRHAYEKVVAEAKTWREKYEAIAKSSPPTGQGAAKTKGNGDPVRARDRLFAELDKHATG